MKKNQIKTIAFAFVTAIFFLTAINTAAQSEKNIAAIRAEVASINKKANKYTKTTKDVTGLSLEGTEATYYLDGRDIVKITAKIYGETYNNAVEVYYSGGKPIFVFSRQNKYDAPIGSSKKTKIVSSEEQRIYFEADKTAKILIGKTVLKPADARYGESETSLREIAEKLAAAYSE